MAGKMESNYESDEKVRKFQEGLRDAQRDAVTKILAKGADLVNFIEVVDNTSWFAKEMRDKIVDRTSPKIACKERCHWCCHQYVGVSAPEIFRIAQFINTECSEKEKQEYIKKLRSLNEKTKGKTPRERAKVNMPCAFLSYGNCKIYQVRPLLCQRQTSYSVAECKKAQPKGFPFGSIISEKAQLVAYNGAISGMFDGLKEMMLSIKDVRLELTAATLSVLVGETTFTNWLQGGAVFDCCELVENAQA